MVSERNANGYDIVSQNYFSELRVHLNRSKQAPGRSSLCEARQKLSWEAFRFLLDELNQEAKPWEAQAKWKGHHVRAIDGSFITLPASEEILKQFPRRTTSQSKTHYPFGLLVTATNILTGQPVAARFTHSLDSERKNLIELMNGFNANDVSLLDRGFEGISVFAEFEKRNQFFVARVRTRGGRTKAVADFLKSGKRSLKTTLYDEESNRHIPIRFIRRQRDRKGDPIVIATNLTEKHYTDKAIWKLYLKRWDIETMYYRVKELFQVENFHARTVNGILQEIFANLFLLSLTALVVQRTMLERKRSPDSLTRLSFKNAAEVVRRNFMYFVHNNRVSPTSITRRMLNEVEAVTYRHQPDRQNPRISKQPSQQWQRAQKNKPRNEWEKRRLANA